MIKFTTMCTLKKKKFHFLQIFRNILKSKKGDMKNEFAKNENVINMKCYDYSSRCSRSILMLMTKSPVFKTCHLQMFLLSNSKALNYKRIY